MTTHTTIRMEEKTKREFSEVCERMGLTATGAINLFVTKVIQNRRIPFDISADADPFWGESNQRALERSMAQANAGETITFKADEFASMEGMTADEIRALEAKARARG